ncbi:MAG: hypothetical protein ACYTG0_00825 [Planctomycetota bacterium]|jgi:hypothetical protein
MRREWIPAVLVLAVGTAGPFLPCSAQPAAERPKVSAHLGGPEGVRICQPGRWGIVAVDVVNTGDEPAEVLATMYFADDPNCQYGRRLWVPKRARRHSWCPIRPPSSIPPETTKVELVTLLYDHSGSADALVRRSQEPMLQSRLMRIDRPKAVTAMIWDAGSPKSRDESPLDAATALRMSAGLTPQLAVLHGDFLPPVVESLQGLDQLVLASDQLASDTAGLTAIRRWLFAGGHLWIMLDRVDPTTVELLLGDAFRCHVVDRVGLTRVEIVEPGPKGRPYEDQPRDFEEPVELVRVLVSDVEVTHSVNGWPASFWLSAGRGRVLVTTLGPHGWMRPATRNDAMPDAPFPPPRFFATQPFDVLAADLFRPPEPPALYPGAFEPYLAEQIGYRVIGRGWVTAVLGGFCLVLFVGGSWLSRRRLERMAWIGPAAAVTAATTLIVLGWLARTAVPPTVAMTQLVELQPGADDVVVTGLMATYNQKASNATFGARSGGIFELDVAGLGGRMRRMVWTDMDAWHWENLTLPPGVRTAPFLYATKTEEPIRARAAFGPEGLSGALAAGPFRRLADGVVVAPSGGCLAVRLEGDGAFSARADAVLAPGQYLTGAFLSDEQRRRQSIYGELFASTGPGKYPRRLTLLTWAAPLDVQFALPEEARRTGSALLALPIEIERSPANTQVTIPSPLLDYRSVRGPLPQASAAYNYRTHEWIELRTSSQVCLRFQIPAVVRPIRLERATLTIRISAPSRELRIVGWASGQEVSLATRNGPLGAVRVDVDRADVLQLDDGGGLLLGVFVGGQQQASLPTDFAWTAAGDAWRIDALELEVAGRTLPRAE